MTERTSVKNKGMNQLGNRIYTGLSSMLYNLKNVDNIGIGHIKDVHEEIFCSYQSLHLLALKTLYILKSAGLRPRDELIFLSRNKEWGFIFFWACVYGGIRFVFGNENENAKEQFINFSTLCKRPFFIAENENYYASYFEQIPFERKLTLPDRALLEAGPADESLVFPAKEEDIVAIIFSSGSIQDPKGVTITHRSTYTFAKAFAEKMDLYTGSDALTWMSLGTITDFMVHHIVPLYTGSMQYHLSNLLFSQKPFYLCDLISEKRITYTTLINSMFPVMTSYANCGEHGWDLHCMRYVLVGAEPVTEKASTDFLSAMKTYGLDKNCLKPGYGLSETMSAVTVLDPNSFLKMLTIDDMHMNLGDKIQIVDSSYEHSHTFVSVGTSLDNVQIEITDQYGKRIGEGHVGIIKVKGPTVSRGYYGKDGDLIDESGWFDTGDIGFLEQGHLYIVGRYKDMFIVNGRNYYYNDLEHKLSLIANIDVHNIVLVCTDTGEVSDIHELVCFIKWENAADGNLERLCASISEYCLEYYALKLVKFVILSEFPKTNSGKVQRYEMRKLYEEKHPDYRNCLLICKNIKEKNNREDILKDLQEIFGHVLHMQIDIDDEYRDYINDSLYLAKIHLLIDNHHPGVVSLAQMFNFITIEDIADEILKHK